MTDSPSVAGRLDAIAALQKPGVPAPLARGLTGFVLLQPLSTAVTLDHGFLLLETSSRPDYISGNQKLVYSAEAGPVFRNPILEYFEFPAASLSEHRSPEVGFRPMVPDDLQGWLDCARDVLQDEDPDFSAWLHAEYMSLLEAGILHGIVAHRGDSIVGALIAGHAAGIIFADEIILRKEYRGRGFSSSMLRLAASVVGHAFATLGVWVSEDSVMRQGLLKKGFHSQIGLFRPAAESAHERLLVALPNDKQSHV